MRLVARGARPETWPDDLAAGFASLPSASHWVLALSGGMDSLFLLHCLAALRHARQKPLRAIHINHGLQDCAADWAAFCEDQCQQLDIPIQISTLNLNADAPDLEATARDARYQVFREQLREDELLFMAHHGNDQAETLLLRLLRGSGVRGLAAMPATRPLGQGTLHRPLLNLSRARIETLTRDWGLSWCEDASNLNPRFDRNYLRHHVLPPLQERWPGVVESLSRSAAHCREADELLDDLARQDRTRLSMEQGLKVSGLRTLSGPRQRNLVRFALQQQAVQPPGEARLHSGLEALLTAEQDRSPLLEWDGWTIRRYRDGLWLVPVQPPVNLKTVLAWSLDKPLTWAGSDLTAITAPADRPAKVTFRQGGERFRPGPGRPTKVLKTWLQEEGVPPWEREHLPLVWDGDELVGIGEYWSADGWSFRWQAPSFPL